jgi:hypothetical protein
MSLVLCCFLFVVLCPILNFFPHHTLFSLQMQMKFFIFAVALIAILPLALAAKEEVTHKVFFDVNIGNDSAGKNFSAY